MKELQLFLLFMLVFSACSENPKKRIQGAWEVQRMTGEETSFDQINFRGDSVDLVYGLGFVESATYDFSGNRFKVYSKYDSLLVDAKVDFITPDSIEILEGTRNLDMHPDTMEKYDISFEGAYFSRMDSFVPMEEYELLDFEVKREKFGSNLFLSKFSYRTFHLYRKNGELKLRKSNYERPCEYVDISDLNSILSNDKYLQGDNSSRLRLVFFIGKDVTLSDLKQIYLNLKFSDFGRRIYFVTKKDVKTDRAYVDWNWLKASLDVDYEELFNYGKNNDIKHLMDMPPPFKGTKEEGVKEGKARMISISNSRDMLKINSIKTNELYFIPISSDLPLEDYFSLTIKINEKEKEGSKLLVTYIVD